MLASSNARALGLLGASKGGKARAKKLSSQERSFIASRAASARWKGTTRRYNHQDVVRFCQEHHIKRCWLFGSVLRSDFSPDSDVDVMVEPISTERLSWRWFCECKEALIKIFRRPVDLVLRSSVETSSNAIRKQDILSTAREVYAAA